MSETSPTGVIHDIGYRHYTGPRHGRGYAVRALTVHSLRGVFGLGRTARAKIIPYSLVAIMMLPAVVQVAAMALISQRPLTYSGFVPAMQVVLAIFLASQSPFLVAPDLRFRVLPLYLSRPVTPRDYVGAKLLAMTSALFLLIAIPLTVMYIGELVIDMRPGESPFGEALGPAVPSPDTVGYLGSMAFGLVYALLLAAVGVAVASFTPRRGLGVASVIALYLLASGVSVVLNAVFQSTSDDVLASWALLVNPFFLVNAVQNWIFGGVTGTGLDYPDMAGPLGALAVLALIALSTAAMLARYRKAASA
ncbi:ABC transporter permease [Sinosporangium siamense]|uniref:Uncharacterized protein n=1 Tax=Sinosporangium siamense TaxID=1367973 RepID=A0A919V5F8_9ACTN|nr:ABC transporter permease [Sinosporangium siamense]GII90811.1 hypothetical protein Ssi02_10420 [Sinosporangium siamense]